MSEATVFGTLPVEQRFTWSEFIATATQAASEGILVPQSEVSDPTWTMCASFAEAERFARDGWKAGRERITTEFRRIQAALPVGNDVTARFTEAGDEVDVGLYLEGEPECMVEYTMAPRRKPVVKLVVSVSASSAISKEVFFTKGAAMAMAVDGLESAGIRVELEADWSSSMGGKVVRRRITVKEADEPLDMDRVAFALANPGMLRHLCFRLYEIHGKGAYRKASGEGYGYPADPLPSDDAEYIVGRAMYGDERWNSPQSAAKAVTEIIAELEAKAQ